MVQPPPLSIRPGEERLGRIDAYAADHKLSRHLAILLMLDEGYRALTKPVAVEAKPAPRPKSALAVHVDVPVYAPKAFNPLPKTGRPK